MLRSVPVTSGQFSVSNEHADEHEGLSPRRHTMKTALLALLAVTLLVQANPFENERCETVIVTLPDNSKMRCEVCDGVTRRCVPV